MKRTLHVLLSLFFLAIFSQKANATHVMGMDLSWKCMGNDSFEVKLIVYRRCTDGAAALNLTSIPFTLTGDSCNDSTTGLPKFFRSYTVEDITPLCNTFQKVCPISGGTGSSTSQIPVGVEKHTIKYIIYLGGNLSNCCWFKLRWQLCCRNSNISTGYADADFYSQSWLNKCTTKCNNGPEFLNPPMIIACAGQDIVYNHGVQESDGDSLSYEMAAPLGGSYASPWSYNYPLTCLGGNNANPNANPPTGFNIDPVNGNISFRPMQVQITVLKIMVTEWRKDSNGIYFVIGKTARDMQFSITQNCNNKLPTISNPFSFNACAGEELCVYFNSNDQDLTDTTTIFWNGGIPKASWTDNNGNVKKAIATFCWTPDSSDIRSAPHFFTITVHDNHCPVIGKYSRSIAITVKASLSSSRSYYKINCSLVEGKINTTNGAAIKWYLPKLIGATTPDSVVSTANIYQYRFPISGKYLIKNSVALNGCTKIYLDTIQIDSNKASTITAIGNTILCPSESITITSDTNTNYQWYNDTILIPGANARSYTTSSAGKYSVRTNFNNCFMSSNTIQVFEINKPLINKLNPLCVGDTAIYTTIAKTGATFQWYYNGAALTNEVSNILKATQDGIYYCKVTHPSCTVQTNADTLTFLPAPTKPTLIMNNGRLFCSTTASSYQWLYDTLIIPGANSSSYIPPKSGAYRVRTYSINGCVAISNPYVFNVGINALKATSSIKIAPNPFDQVLKIEIVNSDVMHTIRLYDILGRLVVEKIFNEDIFILNTSHIKSGFYFLEIVEDDYHLKYKLEKK